MTTITATKGQPIRVAFDAHDLALIHSIASARQGSKDARGIADGKIRPDKGAEIHRIGYAGALALARYLDVPPDVQISPRGNKGRSVRYGASTLNTHYNSRKEGDLRYHPGKVPTVDALVLIGGSLPTLEIVGWIPRATFMAHFVEIELPNMGARWLFHRAALQRPDTLKAWLDGSPTDRPAPAPQLAQATMF